MRVAFEFRHESWLRRRRVRGAARARRRALPRRRRRSCADARSWSRRRRGATCGCGGQDYDDAELDAWAERVTRAGWRDAYVFFKHEDEGTGTEAGRQVPASASAAPPDADPLSCKNLVTVVLGGTVTYMARAIAGATISFGLVSIPVKLYSATRGVGEHLLQPAARQVRLAPEAAVHLSARTTRSSRATTWSRATSSPRTSTSSSRPRSSRRSRRRRPRRSRSPSSCRVATVDPVFFDKAYYLGPEKGGEKAYRLLAEAMKQTGRAALASTRRAASSTWCMVRPAEDRRARDAAAALRRRGAPVHRGADGRRARCASRS